MADDGVSVVPVTRRQLVIAGIILAALVVMSVFLVRGNNNEKKNNDSDDETLQSSEDSSVTDESNDENEGSSTVSVENEDRNDERKETAGGAVESADTEASAEVSQINSARLENWTANDYVEGEIAGETYTVKYGDTLWEIAEARYGSGYEWKTIFDANDVSLLQNGNPLIVPGQVLTLP